MALLAKSLIGVGLIAYAAVFFVRPYDVCRRPHQCRACGYDVRTTFGDKCPECGTPLPAHLLTQPRQGE